MCTGKQAAWGELVFVDGVEQSFVRFVPVCATAEQLDQVSIDVRRYPIRVARVADEHEMQVFLGNAVFREHFFSAAEAAMALCE